MEDIYRRYNIPLGSVDYLEAHGTGTPVGDPVEAQAIGKTFSPLRTTPLKIGSVKSNFGHSECAAGVTATIKVALMLEKRAFCPTINFESPNSNIDFEALNLEVQTKFEVFKTASNHRMGINSFGFAGALAHAILEEAPRQVEKERHKCNWTFGAKDSGDHILVPLSTKSASGLQDLAQRWSSLSSTVDALSVVSWLSTRRRHHESRLAIIANSGDSFRDLLAKYQAGESDERLIARGLSEGKQNKQKVCFVFPGQGQQWKGMGRNLFSTEKIFRDTVEECDDILKTLSGTSLINDIGLFKSPESIGIEGLIDEAEICQPAILFFQIGLIRLWSYWGVQPDVVIGHSLGEAAAAYACGGLTLEEAVGAIFHRSNEQRKLKGTGSMAALRKPLHEANQICSEHRGVSVAAINGPNSITIAGKKEAIEIISQENPTFAKRLRVQCAFHTSHMDPIQSSFENAMMGLVKTRKGSKQVPIYSTVTGTVYEGPFDAEYWWQNIRRPVLFQQAVEKLIIEEKPDIILELSSSVTLLSSVRQIAKDLAPERNLSTMASCQRNKDDRVMVLHALGSLYLAGKSINWHNVTNNSAQWLPLPSYPWQHQPHWKESEDRRQKRLGLDDRSFKGQKGHLTLETFPMFEDHVIQDRLIFPGAGYVEYLLQMCFKENENPALRNINFVKTLAWPTKEEKAFCVTEKGVVSLEVVKDGNLVHVNCNEVGHCNAEISHSTESPSRFLAIEEKHSTLPETITKEEFYHRLRRSGLEYGPAFQVVNKASLGDGEALGHLDPVHDSLQRIHTTILDGCFQLIISALGPCTSLYIPVKVEYFQMEVPSLPPGEPLTAYAKVVDCDSTRLTGDVILATSGGTVLANVVGMEARSVSSGQPQYEIKNCLYSTEWQLKESRINLATFTTDLHPENLSLNYQEELNAIHLAKTLTPGIKEVSAAYIQYALEVTPKEEQTGWRTRYVQWLEEIAGNATPGMISYQEIPEAMENIKRALPVMKEELSALQTFGEALPVILKTQNAEKSPSLAKKCWQNCFHNSLTTRIYHKAGATSIVSAIKKASTEKHVIRVLVVGDHMASLSQYILPPLKEKGMKREMEYIFAMQTTSALQQAKEQLEDFPFVRYEFVDIGKSLQEQGLILQSFDVVLCLYTLHSAVDVNSSLLHLQSLLCERGCLLIYEVTDLKFGSLGICRLDDLDRAKSLLSEGEVMEIMARNGFDDVQSVSSPSEVCQSMVVGYKCPEALISNASRSLKEGHNYVIIGRETNPLAQDLVQCLSDAGRVEIVSEVSKIRESNGRIPQGKVVLYIHSSTDEDVAFVTTLLQEIYKILGVQGLWVLTAGAAAKQHHNLEGSSVVGLLRAAGNHIHKFPVFSVDLDPSNSSKRNALHVSNLLRDPPPDHELAFDQDICLVPRVLPCSLPEARVRQVHNWELGIGTTDGSRNHGADDIQFLAAANTHPQDDELMIQVKAAGLNFKDVMMAMGMLEKLEVDDRNSRLGLECCGVVVGTGSSATGFEIGDEVIAFTSSCFASHVKCRPHNVVHKPRNLSWTDRAGIGIVFTTAYYSLVDRAGLKKGETVLIHSACGGVGLAAIQIARMKKANVICSAGTEEKRLFLKTTMGVEHVTDSRSQQFYSDVMEWTGGKGVDVVLNSLHGDLLRKGIDLLAHGGRFCAIGKRDILENSKLLMRVFLENKSFLSCHVDILLRNQPQKFTSTFKEVLQLLENGAIQPIKTTTYSISAFRDTFRTMSKGAHIGKIVFDVSADSLPTTVQMSPKIFKPNATYIITGGFGGIGLALCRWMSQKGAKHMVMVSRHGCHTGAGRRTLAFLKKRGVNVYEFAGDLAEESFVKSMISEVRQTSAIPPIKGIFHLAGVIHEESFSNLRTDHINLMFGSKARSAQHLHHHTLDEPLDVFLLMSSLVTVWGNPAQPSYCAANSALDALACYRHSLGLPALSVQLGPVRGAGFLEGRSEATQRLASKGTLTMHIDDILTVLGQLLQVCDKPVICLANQDWTATQNFVHETSLKFRHLAQNPQTPSKNTSVTPEMLAEQITKRLGDLLNVPTNAIELHQQMTNYGVDSLMAIELITWAKKDLHVSITQLDVLNGMTAATLLKKASRKI